MKRMLVAAVALFVLVGATVAQKSEVEKEQQARIERAKNVLDALVKKDFGAASKDFNEETKATWSPEMLEKVWKEVLAQIGEYKEIYGVAIESRGPGDQVTVTCKFEKEAVDVIVTVGEKQILGFDLKPNLKMRYKSPEYVKKDQFTSIDLTLNPKTKWELPGTLTMPKGNKGPFPAVVLVHGSGPNDRDEAIAASLPFRDLAEGLASKGIAVYRYEKRTKQHGYLIVKQNIPLTLKDEVIDDAVDAVALVRKQKDIDPRRVYVLGHSLGGHVAPQIGERDKDIAGLILLAGSNRPIREMIIDQVNYLVENTPNLSDADKKQVEEIKAAVERLKDEKELAKKLSTEQILGAPVSYWLSLFEYEKTATKTASNLKMPMLILQGERDYQVTMKDFDVWKDALKGRKNVAFKSYPTLNHLFIHGEGKSMPIEYARPMHVSQEVLDEIVGWINKKP
jgi:dienelactone hydrolase